MLDFIVKYWIEWVCGLIAAGVVFLAKHYVLMQKRILEQKWKEREEEAKNSVIQVLENELKEEISKSDKADEEMKEQIDGLYYQMENLTTGILSIQGKQFRDCCLLLLENGHEISVQEYEQFESDYVAYKALGGNHNGDALHDRVIEKFTNQLK